MQRLAFDRGTLRIDGPPAPVPWIRHDPRTGFHRAPAYRYAELIALVPSMQDDVAPQRLSLRPGLAEPALRPYQREAVEAFEAFDRRGVVVLPTGSGKTRVACAVMARAGCSALVLVPTRVLLEQWRSALSTLHPLPIGVVGDGQHDVRALTVMTFESAYRKLDRLGHLFGTLVVDEVHHFASGLRAEALEMCPAPIRLGLTATAPHPDSPGAERLRRWIGPVVCELGIDDLVGTHLAELDSLRMHVALSDDERVAYERDIAPWERMRADVRRADPFADFTTVLAAVSRAPGGRDAIQAMHAAARLSAFPRAKRRLVASLAHRHWGERTLIFTATADDAYTVGRDLLVPVITAQTPRAEREEILASFSAGDLRAIVSAQVLNEGIDVPSASVAIIAAGALGAREYVQRVGRVLRPEPGKRATVYELVTLDTLDEAKTRGKRRRLAARAPALAR